MTDFIEKIKKKINSKINPEKILLIDKSKLHSKHKSFEKKKFYLKIIICSKKLKSMGKIEGHKEIFSILKDELKNDIHALEIEIK